MELPLSFRESIGSLLGAEAFDKLVSALLQEPPVSIRVNNRYKWDMDEVAWQHLMRVPWTDSGYYLPQRPAFTFDPLFHAGCYYVQEASSMFVEQAIRQYVKQPVLMLDLCAAPGGKSTHLLSVLPEGSMLVVNEVMRNRVQILAENVAKWGSPQVVVTHNDPADFMPLKELFDVMLTDVPCSGEGMFRKDPQAVEEWSTENVEICWQRQRRILSDVWDSLKPGGLLIYSTCTFNTQENEENVAWICRQLGAEVLPLDISDTWGITGNLIAADFPVYRFLPHRTRGEGFFMTVLRKHGEATAVSAFTESRNQSAVSSKSARNKKGKQVMPAFPKPLLQQAKEWVKQPDDFEWIITDSAVSIFPLRYSGLLTFLKQHLRIMLAGVEVGALKGRDLIPQHALAMSHVLQKAAFPIAELTYEQAIAYLRKEVVVLDAGIPKGFVLVTYRQQPLGFVKNIGNRANNLYPQEWRIRSGYLPEAMVEVLKSSQD